jgi:stage V sporulation protein B
VEEIKRANSVQQKNDKYLGGVALLSVSTLICKIIGLMFKIPMISYVGIEGMAYFSSAYNIYMMLNSLSAAGLPVALSIMISKNVTVGNRNNTNKVFKTALMIFAILGLIGSVALYFGADFYSSLIGIPNTAPAVRAISPTLFLICLSSAIRGYFQGHEIMTPTAVSQLIESFGKLFLGVGFAVLVLQSGAGTTDGAAAAIFGLSVGVLISVLYLTLRLFVFSRSRKLVSAHKDGGKTDSIAQIIKTLLVISLPITLSSTITSLTSLADTGLITNRLTDVGMTSEGAVLLYSSYSNLAVPLFNLVPALVAPIAISVVPALTGAITSANEEDSKRIFNTSWKLCLALSVPAAAGLAVFSHQILSAVYPGEQGAIEYAAPLLSVLAVAVVFASLTTVTNAVLQAHGKQVLPIVSMSAGAVVKIAAEYLLVGSSLRIYGAPISTVLCTFVISLLNLYFILRHTSHRA